MTPKSVLALRDYSAEAFRNDLIAGITVGLVALPLAMAFAISSGLPPQSGVIALFAGLFVYGLVGSSRPAMESPATQSAARDALGAGGTR